MNHSRIVLITLHDFIEVLNSNIYGIDIHVEHIHSIAGQVNFHPLKYFQLNSRDDKFWIELYNADNPTIPVRLIPHEGYVMELQFMQNDKVLYI